MKIRNIDNFTNIRESLELAYNADETIYTDELNNRFIQENVFDYFNASGEIEAVLQIETAEMCEDGYDDQAIEDYRRAVWEYAELVDMDVIKVTKYRLNYFK